MNKLLVPHIPSIGYESSFKDVNEQLNTQTFEKVDYLLWSNDGYKPTVAFNIAHNGDTIFLKYHVQEDSIRMLYSNINDPVYKDTCVEFFISFPGDASYYNLEFNCAGTCCMGYGSGKQGRVDIAANAIRAIRSESKIELTDGSYNWSITLIIPISVFTNHTRLNLNGLLCRANFYKCGDELPRPHFIAWNNVESAVPNFHLSQFFGEALFLTSTQ